MKSFGEILKEMGFNENAPESVQKALFQHLAAQAEVTKRVISLPDQGPAITKKSEQLSLDFDSVDSIVCNYTNKKVS